MTTVCDLVNDARVAASRAKAILMLRRTGGGDPVASAEAEADRLLLLLNRIEEAVQKAAASAMAKGAAVAAMLAPTGPPLSACSDGNSYTPTCNGKHDAPTAKVPRMGAVVITDVIDGSLDDLRQMVEDSR